MPKVFIRKSSTWPEIKSIFVKKTTGWTEVKNVFLKKTVNSVATWVKVFTKLSLPDTTTPPSIRTTNTSGVGDAYDGPAAESPQFLNANLFGKDGLYTNYTSIFGRKFTSATLAAALPADRSTVVTGDLFTSGGGVTTSDRSALDEKFLFYELTVQNGSSANEIKPISSAIKMIKDYPATNSFGWNEGEEVGTELVFNYNLQNYYYNSVEPGSSYIRWWRSTNTDPGGTLIKQETITATTTGTPSSTSRTGTSRYTPTSSDIGSYIVAEIIAVSSNTRHFGYTDNYSLGSFPTDGVIGSALTFSNVRVEDEEGRKGLDNRDRWPVGTFNRYAWTLAGYDSNTTIRIRYRMYNYSTGRYYKPSTGAIQADTTAGANAAYDSYNSDGSGDGIISSISVSGTTATCYDFFFLDSTYFNGGGGDPPTWWLDVELSALRGGPRVYEMGYAGPNIFYTGKAIDSSISVSPTTTAPNSNVTVSGSLIGTPATPSTNGYPRQYKVNYGDDTDSGWLPVNEYGFGTANPTYSLTKQYSATGTYTISIDTIPYFEISSTTVTVSNLKVPPTMGTPTISAVGAFVTGQRRLSVPFTAVTNSGPAYQIYWYPGENYLGNPKPPVAASIDGSGTTSPIRDESGPNGIGRYAVWIRSSATTSTTGSTAPSTTLSDWSDLQYVYISGTRTLSYNKNTTDTVGSLPSSSSGTDPWDGWVTTVSSNTPTRTGFTFNGYNTQADGTGTNYAASASITLTSDITLYAKWTALTYSVTYDGNSNTGGSVPTDTLTYSNGATVTVKSNSGSLTRTNFVFDGWNTASDGSGTARAATGTATFTMGTANVILYARWRPLYLVSFDLNGGGGTAPTALRQSTSGGSITLPTQGSMTAPSGKPNFSGWVTSSSGTSALTGAYTPTADVTLYAYWTANLPTTTATGVRGYNNFGVSITLPTGTGSVVIVWGTSTSYGNTMGTYTTAGAKSPVGPLLANTTYYFKATPWSGTSGNGTEGTAVTGSVKTYINPAHTAATPVNPTFQRFTSGVNSFIRYGWNNQSALTPTGDYAEWGYEFRVYSNIGLTTQLSGSPFYQAFNTTFDARLINGNQRIYVFSGEGSGTPYAGDFTYTTSSVWGRYRAYYTPHGSTTKAFGNWSNAI
jgi:uncharacterized repeat protein (TIGR02543 family)